MNFFRFRDRFDRTVPRLAVGVESADAWGWAVRGQPSEVLTGHQYMGGRQWKDFLWTGLGGTPIMSDRVRDLLRINGITGWTPYQVRVVDFSGAEISGYSGLGVTGRCGGRIDFDQRESAVIYKPSAKGEPMPWFRGLHFDVNAWDGSDIFMDQDGSGFILVTERVAKLFKKSKVSNCVFDAIESVDLLAVPSEIIRGE